MTLDPELAGLMEHVAGVDSFADLLADPDGMQRLEAFSGALLPYAPPDVPVRSVEAPGPNGPVTIRAYGPVPARAQGPTGSDDGVPGLVWLHGGGFAGGTLDMREADQLARELVQRTGGVVFSVDYRLARDGVHFPVPHEDALAAWLWAATHAGEFGVAPARLCLGGASAGANLAVGAAMYLKDAGEPMPAKLVLAYPFLHAELPGPGHAGAVPSGDAGSEGVMAALPRILRFTADDCRGMVENYIGGPAGMASSYAMPGAADPVGLPPAAVLASECDDLRPSAELFVAGLRRAGIAVEYRLEPGATHGYLNHSAALGVVRQGLSFLAAELESAKPFQ